MFRAPFLSRGRTRGVVWLFVGIAASGCARNLATGQNQLMLVSESQEIAMGRDADPAIIATIGLYPDDTWQRYIQRFGAGLAAASERPNLPWTFRVVDDPAINAFAVPGGFVYVTRGILAHLTSEAQLASVVGHEIGHVTARHTAAQMSQQQLLGLGLAVGSMASAQVAKYASTANQALGILYLKFSRDNERQADELGLRYMRRGNYDPREMPGVFVMLDRQGKAAGSAGRLPEWLATHPSPANRVATITTQIAALPQDFSGTSVNRDAYERLLDGLVFGINPRQGYFTGGRFLHPDLRFQMTFPDGWSMNNGTQAVVAVSQRGDAAVELSQAQETERGRGRSRLSVAAGDHGRRDRPRDPERSRRGERALCGRHRGRHAPGHGAVRGARRRCVPPRGLRSRSALAHLPDDGGAHAAEFPAADRSRGAERAAAAT